MANHDSFAQVSRDLTNLELTMLSTAYHLTIECLLLPSIDDAADDDDDVAATRLVCISRSD